MEDLDSSVDMFEDSTTRSAQVRNWLGSPLEELKPRNICTYPSVRSTFNHTVLFKLPIPSAGHLEPHPSRPDDKWDANHVRMPHSPLSLFPISQSELKSRWKMIRETYNQPVKSSQELERAILSYNCCTTSNELTFGALHEFFRETLREEEAQYFFSALMPNIINLAFEIEDKFRGGLPILKKGSNRSISMSQVQAGVLLANAFLCTFPRRNSSSHQSALPSINFNRLFQCGSLSSVQQKLMCFTNYFRRIVKKRPIGVITFTRRHVRPSELPGWSNSNAKLSNVHISSVGTIEDEGGGMMEIDFANKRVGGGVLGRGAVQEEIRFVVCPELVVARLFCETLDDTEALIVTGCERFNSYEGYAQSFTWSGNYDDSNRLRDSYRRFNTIVVAMDALHFNRSADQFKMEMITRELNKAYTGFSFGQEGAIATGNWGCGAFNGDPLLKFIIQLMAASICEKPLVYFTFEDSTLRDKLFGMHDFLVKRNTTVGTLWKLIKAFATSDTRTKSGEALFDYIYSSVDSGDGDQPMDCDSDDIPNVATCKRRCETQDGEGSVDKLGNFSLNTLCGESCTKSCTIHHNSKPSSKNEDHESPVVEQITRVPTKSLKVEHQPPSTLARTSPPDVENLTIAPKDVIVTKANSVSGFVTKKLSLKSDKPNRLSSLLNDSTDDVFSKDSSSRRFSGKSEPVDAETCSLLTEEGRRKCLQTDQERWSAYQSAMSKFSNETKIENTSPDSSQTSAKTRTGPVKRKISDYFPKSPR